MLVGTDDPSFRRSRQPTHPTPDSSYQRHLLMSRSIGALFGLRDEFLSDLPVFVLLFLSAQQSQGEWNDDRREHREE
jgi:hypothetical protein